MERRKVQSIKEKLIGNILKPQQTIGKVSWHEHSCSMQELHSFRELIVWQRAMELTVAIYKLTESFPKTEQFGLTEQMRRAAVSIISNIAEGRHRGTRGEFMHFLNIALGSTAELEAQLLLAKRLSIGMKSEQSETLVTEVMLMLRSMLSKLNHSTQPAARIKK